MVLPEDLDLGVGVADAVAVEEEGEFCGEGDADGDDGGKVEGVRVGWRRCCEGSRAEGDEDEGDGRHEEAEGYVAGCFDAGFAGGVFAAVDAGDGPVAEEEHYVGEGVEDRVGHRGEEGEGARGDGGVDLEDREDDVGGEGAVNCDLVAEGVALLGFARVGDVGVDGLEEAFDLVVLFRVEGGHFALFACIWAREFFGVLVAVAEVEGVGWTVHCVGRVGYKYRSEC